MSSGPTQFWTLDHDGQSHRVEASGSTSHHVTWWVDGEQVAEKKAWEDKLVLDPEGDETGQVVVRFSALGKPRRATLFAADEQAEALTGLGGIDLVPEPGSPAAAHEDKVRLHPTRYAAIATGGGVAKVVVPILLGLLVVRFAISVDWPDLPSIPWPDLPSIPWPDLPGIPWPDLPDVSAPAWLRWLLDKLKYVWPVVLAYVIARAEIRRRRKQDELRKSRGARTDERQE